MYDWLNLIWLSTVKQMFRFIMSSSNWDILSEKPRIVRTSDNHVHFNHQYASILPFDITWVTPRELKQFIQTKTFVHSNGHHWTLSIWFFPCSCGFQSRLYLSLCDWCCFGSFVFVHIQKCFFTNIRQIYCKTSMFFEFLNLPHQDM